MRVTLDLELKTYLMLLWILRKTIYCVILAGLGFVYAWIWLLDNLTIKEEEENHSGKG